MNKLDVVKILFYFVILAVDLPIIYGYFTHNEYHINKWYRIRTVSSVLRYIMYCVIFWHIIKISGYTAYKLFDSHKQGSFVIKFSTIALIMGLISYLIRMTKLTPWKFYTLALLSIGYEFIMMYMLYKEMIAEQKESKIGLILNEINTEDVDELINVIHALDEIKVFLDNKQYTNLTDLVNSYSKYKALQENLEQLSNELVKIKNKPLLTSLSEEFTGKKDEMQKLEDVILQQFKANKITITSSLSVDVIKQNINKLVTTLPNFEEIKQNINYIENVMINNKNSFIEAIFGNEEGTITANDLKVIIEILNV